MNSFVQITSPPDLIRTLLSSQALFTPFNYYISSTQLVQLSSVDNVCTGSLQTDISNKIVLIMPINGDCSYVSKIYGAQQNGAKAVLIANNDQSSHIVVNIINDNPSIDIKIPARMITFDTATLLSSNLNISAVPSLQIEFGCSNQSNISSVICIIDESGDNWELDGDYQLQQDLKKNDHNVWIKEGYLFVLKEDYYLFLHSGNGTEDWYWAITTDSNMINDELIVAKCAIGSIDDPIDCPIWYTSDSSNTLIKNEDIKINNTLCAITDNYICIKSSQSNLAGLYGSYRQFNAKTPYWFREWVDCDTQPGKLEFVNYVSTGLFLLIDPFDFWVVAQCVITGYTEQENEEYVAFHPELCTEWKTLVDGSLDAAHKIYDPTFSVSVGSCGNYECPPDFEIPDKICMTRNSIMHSFLEGNYQRTGIMGNKWNTSEWSRTEKLYYNGEYIPVYVWYYGEVSDSLNWWVVSNTDLATAIKNNGSSVYGFCASNTNSPTNCLSCWNFYFSASDTDAGAWHSDCKFEMLQDECNEIDSTINYEWPNYLCIRDNRSIIYDGNIDFDQLIGGYKINVTLLELSGFPYWYKPPNDYNDNETYIYYDEFYGYWQIGDKLHSDSAELVCMEESTKDYLPTHCRYWYDENSNNLGNLFIYSEDCTERNMLSKTVKTERDNTAIIVVLVCLGLIALFIAGLFYYKHSQRNETQKAGFSAPPTSGGRKIGSSESIELGDDVDQMGLVRNTNKGGMDMSPLNKDSIPIHDVDHDDDDDDDDLTDDAQQNDIVDDGDDDEELMGDTKTKDTELRLPNDNDGDPVSPDPDIIDTNTTQQPITTSIMDE